MFRETGEPPAIQLERRPQQAAAADDADDQALHACRA